MKTDGVFIKRARYNSELFGVLDVEFALWSIKDQCEYLYRAWINPNNDGGSSIHKYGKLPDGTYGYHKVISGSRDACKEKLEEILIEYRWGYWEFRCYVAGYCDAMAKMESDRIHKRGE